MQDCSAGEQQAGNVARTIEIDPLPRTLHQFGFASGTEHDAKIRRNRYVANEDEFGELIFGHCFPFLSALRARLGLDRNLVSARRAIDERHISPLFWNFCNSGSIGGHASLRK